jgi:hypothetical protein
MEHLSTGTRINRMSILRQFCLYFESFRSTHVHSPPEFSPSSNSSGASHLYRQ